MSTTGFLIPPWYHAETPSIEDMKVVCIIWGFTLAFALVTFFKAFRQTWRAYKRKKLFCGYVIMIWAEWVASLALSILSWLYLNPESPVREGFWTYAGLLIPWVIQVQCILQIVINRLRYIMDDRRRANHLKWGVAIIVGLINISVWIIWIPARLQISHNWILINNIWDRIEKAIFAIIDICLNAMFVHLVRIKMISNGLTKYNSLFRFNVFTIFLSLSLDILLIGMMSLQDTAAYIQFQSLVYILKLLIEMSMAELLARVVKATNELKEYSPQGSRVKTRPLHRRIQSTDSGIYGIFRFSISPTIVEDIETTIGRRPTDVESAEGNGILGTQESRAEKRSSNPETAARVGQLCD